jgi:hypothetical protein
LVLLLLKKRTGVSKDANRMIETTRKLILVGDFAVEVAIDLLHDNCGWSYTVSFDDVPKLDRVRKALGEGDIGAASNDTKVFQLVPVQL